MRAALHFSFNLSFVCLDALFTDLTIPLISIIHSKPLYFKVFLPVIIIAVLDISIYSIGNFHKINFVSVQWKILEYKMRLVARKI